MSLIFESTLISKSPAGSGGAKDVTKLYVDQQDINVLNEANAYTNSELYRPEHYTIIVTAMTEGIGFKSDYTARQIKEHADGGGVVILRFNAPDGSGEQSYPYETFKNGRAIFRRALVDNKNNIISRIIIEIDDNYNVYKKDEAITVATLDDIQYIEDNKADYKIKVINQDKVTQTDALEVLTYYDQYEGRLIEFLTNGDMPNKPVATGRIFTNKNGDTYLVTYNLNGTTTIWNKDNYEKHNVETYSYINQMIDLDNLTIDARGEAPYVASVQKAINKPSETSDFGIITVIAYSIDKQMQIYRDVNTGLSWIRLITGTADKHSFDVWKLLDISKDYIDTELSKRVLIPRVYENLTDRNPILPNIMPNSVYKLGTIDSLTIKNIPNSPLRTTFIFTIGNTEPKITLPSNLEKTSIFKFKTNTKYIINIENGIATLNEIVKEIKV